MGVRLRLREPKPLGGLSHMRGEHPCLPHGLNALGSVPRLTPDPSKVPGPCPGPLALLSSVGAPPPGSLPYPSQAAAPPPPPLPVLFLQPRPQEQVPGHRQQEGLSGGDDDDGYSCRSWPVGRTCRRQSHLDELDTGSLSLEGCKREFPREGTQYCWGSEEAGGRGPRGRLLRRQGGKWEGASRQGWGQGPGPRGTAPAKVEA